MRLLVLTRNRIPILQCANTGTSHDEETDVVQITLHLLVVVLYNAIESGREKWVNELLTPKISRISELLATVDDVNLVQRERTTKRTVHCDRLGSAFF